MRIHISIVDYFKAPRLIESLQALEQQSLFDLCQVTVFDNSVDDENFIKLNEYIKHKKNISLIRSSFNRGYTKATNLSVDFSTACSFLTGFHHRPNSLATAGKTSLYQLTIPSEIFRGATH